MRLEGTELRGIATAEPSEHARKGEIDRRIAGVDTKYGVGEKVK
jgi:hypothetical protein